ncbi:hypothetical protein [Paenibacillus sp. YIM B09110]|uniref:hypothetical protein n=1 Tax=Paenibacillus sp. YIM B09110 TaxID=3126102 RepID=UPI00301E4435
MDNYKIAYGTERIKPILSSKDLDKLIAESLKEEPSKLAKTVSEPQNKPKHKPAREPVTTPINKLTDAFKHLKTKTIKTTTQDASEAFAHLRPKVNKLIETEPFAHIRGGK